MSYKSLVKILVLAIIDFILIWFWVDTMNPDPSISIALIILVPMAFILNILIALILYFLKKKEYSFLFLINSVISSVLIFIIFNKGIENHQNKLLESWTFQKNDTIFMLTRWKLSDSFSMSYSLNPGSSWSYWEGQCVQDNESNQWILSVSDSVKLKISDDYLIGFRKETDTIKMSKN
ncbi:MAG: hypothetical protein WCY89_08555 [Flavobacteriaceae bacterium]